MYYVEVINSEGQTELILTVPPAFANRIIESDKYSWLAYGHEIANLVTVRKVVDLVNIKTSDDMPFSERAIIVQYDDFKYKVHLIPSFVKIYQLTLPDFNHQFGLAD